MRGAAGRRHTVLLTFEFSQRFDRRRFGDRKLHFAKLGREKDLYRDAVRRNAERTRRARAERNVDGIRDDRTGWRIHVSELDPFDFEALLLDELHLLHRRTEADAHAAGPVTDLD